MRPVSAVPVRRVIWLVPLMMAANLAAQERPLPPSPAPRAEPPGRERAPDPPATAASPSVEELLQRAGLTRAELERRKANPASKAHPPSPTAEPPTPEERSRAERANEQPPAALRSPSLEELLSAVRQQPGGADVLDRARRAGARIPQASENGVEDDQSARRARGGPSVIASARTSIPRAFPTQTVLRVTRSAPSQTVSGLGSLSAEAFFPYRATNNIGVWGPLDRLSDQNTTYSPVGGPFDVKSWVRITLTAQNAGWYLINVQATPTRAELRRYTFAGYELLMTFTKPTTSGYNSYPVVLNLEAGSHGFYWANLDWFPYVSEVTVMKL
jgi:hypothetical protein